MIEDLRLECTDNGGYIVCYTEVTKPPSNGTDRFVNQNYDYKKESYGSDESVKAISRMHELALKMKTNKEEEKKSDTDLM